MACLTNPISQPSLEISPIWTPLISQEVINSWGRSACLVRLFWQGNGPVGHVETSPEIFLVYRAHLVMMAHKILAASTLRKGVKKLPKFGTYSSNSRNRARAWRPCAKRWRCIRRCILTGVRRPNVDKAMKDLRTVTHTAGLTTRQTLAVA
jgi:hypothetical protein